MRLKYFALVALVIALPLRASNLPNFPFVLAVGSAEREVSPNEATISLHILAFEEKSEDGVRKVSIASDAILRTLEKYNIDTKYLEANDLKKSTTRDRGDNYKRLSILGYEITRFVKLRLLDLSSYGEIVDDLAGIDGVSEIHSRFDIVNRETVETELIAEAAQDAKGKASVMAESLGTSIHSVYAMSQASDFGDFFATFGAHSLQGGGFARDAVYTPLKTFIPETISVKQSVNVVFRIKKN